MCCGPIHEGSPAPSAERLMRSRYSAFALGNADYLLATWDARERPSKLGLDPELRWLRLIVESSEHGGPLDHEGWVTFTAIARGPEGRLVQRERSRFARASGGAWVYVDGTPLDPEL